MIIEAIQTAMEGRDLPFETASLAMGEIMDGHATNAQIAAFLTALRMKGETINEITACAAVMREKSVKIPRGGDLLEIVGTGGDKAYTFNISTVSAFVAAAAGAKVAKHGNRSVSSRCGAADVLEALGANITLSAAESARVLEKTGMCFMFAPIYHASMRYAAPVRKEIGVRTIFNILGPLANPAGANIELLGVYGKSLLSPLANTLLNLGVGRAMVVCGDDGLDEITLSAPTEVCEVRNGGIARYSLDPRDFGFDFCRPEELTGGGPQENAKIARAILGGETGAKRDTVLMNAGACLYLYGFGSTIAEGIKIAAEAVASGRAYAKMEEFIAATKEAAQ